MDGGLILRVIVDPYSDMSFWVHLGVKGQRMEGKKRTLEDVDFTRGGPSWAIGPKRATLTGRRVRTHGTEEAERTRTAMSRTRWACASRPKEQDPD